MVQYFYSTVYDLLVDYSQNLSIFLLLKYLLDVKKTSYNIYNS